MATAPRKTPRTAGNPRRPQPTVVSVNRRVDDLATRNIADHEQMLARLGGHDRSIKLAKKANDRLARLVSQLGDRLASDHDSLVAEVTPRLDRLEELVGQGVGLDMASAIVGFTPDEVRLILEVQGDGALSNSDIVSGLVEGVRSLKAQLHAVGDVVAEHTQRLDGHDRQLAELYGHDRQVATLQQTWTRRLITDHLHIGQRFSVLGSVIGVCLGVIAWFVIWFLGDNLSGNVHGTGENTDKVVGTFQANLHYGWIGACIGLILAGVVIVLTSHFVATVDEEVEETTETRNGDGNNAAPQPPAANNNPVDQPQQGNDGHNAAPARTAPLNS